MSRFSEILKSVRLERNITQTDMHRKLGCARQTYIDKEAGKYEPTYSEIIECAKILGIPVSLFFDGFCDAEEPTLLRTCTDIELSNEVSRRLKILRDRSKRKK
ncbi:helix-turn-helix transcriptional regulator [Photobacterium damselae]|uniref:helix-turn-helix transcriptional regulator n=1 Tax=Photobacterium damselae TaxID=38293 RepID=UPI002F41CF1F